MSEKETCPYCSTFEHYNFKFQDEIKLLKSENAALKTKLLSQTAGINYESRMYDIASDEVLELQKENAKLKKESISFADLSKWLEQNRQGFYLGCRIDEHSPQINEFVQALHYYLEKDFGYTTDIRKALKQLEQKD